ncbi:hypothetical protein AB0D98_13625 [Streptomyces sp. NPDC047987]|uniref:hypothetical protein n=1 Tax=unclassified Streptomyces TaxID=2593676 RepID=UPI00341745D6
MTHSRGDAPYLLHTREVSSGLRDEARCRLADPDVTAAVTAADAHRQARPSAVAGCPHTPSTSWEVAARGCRRDGEKGDTKRVQAGA